MAEEVTIDPTIYVVDGPRTTVRGEKGRTTLLWLANRYGQVTIGDLRALNPHLDDVEATQMLPAGTEVKLPFTMPEQRLRPAPTGSTFTIAEMEARMDRCDDRLDRCLAKYKARAASGGLPPFPDSCRIQSPLEQLRGVVDREAAAQLPYVEAFTAHLENVTDDRLQAHVDADVAEEQMQAIMEKFSAPSLPHLRSFQCSAGAVPDLSTAVSGNALTVPEMQPTRDEEADTCGASHKHRWELVVSKPSSIVMVESWAILSCQTLVSFLDAMREVCLRRTSSGHPVAVSQDSFLYIGGVFYVDDRHEGHADMTAAIRSFRLPSGDEPTPSPAEAHQNVFHHCPVRSAAQTRWRDVRIRQGEVCAFMHLGDCSHYFYLDKHRYIGAPTPFARTQRDQYPHRVAKRKDNVLWCQLCKTYPAMVALYGDRVSPTSPAVYCDICDTLLHCNSAGKRESSSEGHLRLVPHEPETFFTLQS